MVLATVFILHPKRVLLHQGAVEDKLLLKTTALEIWTSEINWTPW